MREYKLAVYIGRFQPFHNAHLHVLNHGLKIADKVLIIVGSHRATLTIKNPFTFEQRKEMILDSIFRETEDDFNPRGELDRVLVEPIRDYYEQDQVWVANVQNIVSKYTDEGDAIALLGSYKDSSSYYINYFKDTWTFETTKTEQLDATTIRELLFQPYLPNHEDWKKFVPAGVERAITKNYLETTDKGWQDKEPREFGHIYQCKQFEAIKEHKKLWSSAPFPNKDVTADTVVIQNGHVLLVRRGGRVGKGLFALPGGHVNIQERIEDAALRELKEETGIRLDKNVLRGSIVATKVFDHPGRSLLGRVITHAYVIKLRDGRLIEVKGGDDADKAFWMSFHDINMNEHLFFDDHISIIRWSLSQAGK